MHAPARRFVLALACIAVSGCSLVEPSAARTNSVYRAKAAKTADSVNSSVQTALLSVHLLQTNKVTANTVAVQIDDAADGVTGPHHAFDRVQSPSVVADELQSQLDNLLNQVDAQMSSLSTSVHRHEFDNLDQDASTLQQLSNELQMFSQAQS